MNFKSPKLHPPGGSLAHRSWIEFNKLLTGTARLAATVPLFGLANLDSVTVGQWCRQSNM